MFFAEDKLSLELLGVFKLKRPLSAHKSQNIRNHDSLSIRLSGKGHFKTDTSSVSVKRGDVLYIPKNACYTQKTEGETILTVHFINYSFNKNLKPCVISVDDIPKIEGLFCEMYDTWKEKKQGYHYRCTALFYELLYYLNRSTGSVERAVYRESMIEKAIDFIHRNYRSEQIEISRLAEMCAVSEVYFRRCFKNTYGIAPKQYIINLQLESASQMLQSNLYTVAEAAERSGFSDIKYFSRIFSKRFGMSPKNYRKISPESRIK